MKEWLSINELATKTGIPDTTIRRYIAKFNDFFVADGGSRSKRYDSSGIQVLIQIKDLYDKGLETEQVANELLNDFPIVMKDALGDGSTNKLPALATSDEISDVKNALVELKLSNDKLFEALKERDELLAKRDEEIKYLLTMNKNLLLAIQPPEQPEEHEQQSDSIWSRIFGKKK